MCYLKKLAAGLLCISLCLSLCACNAPYEEEKEETKMNYSILFIGNSYTYYNDMPTAIFEKMATAAGYTVDVTAITKGAWTLEKFADPGDEHGARAHAALTGEKKYDVVILQEQSLRPAIAPDAFYAAVENLAERIRATGASPMLYATWGRHSDSADLEKYGLTNETMTYKLAAAYAAIGEKLDIPVAHAGLAFYEVYTGESGIDLYNPDLSHPSYAGSYLAAATLYTKIFGKAPEASLFCGDLPLAEAEILCQAAENARSAAVPNSYKTKL